MDLLHGFITIFSDPVVLGFVFLGALVGVLIGATPGLTTPAAIAMIVPATAYMEPLPALVFLYVIGKAGRFGGSIAAILFNTPGTTAAAATQLDGHPLAKQGKAGKALKIATLASVTGDTVGEMLLIFGAVWISNWTLKLGPPEYFAIYAMAFIVIGSVVGGSIIKGLMSSFLGVAVAMVGLDVISGVSRYDFGNTHLLGGFHLVPLLIGTFVLSEIILQAERIRFSAVAPKMAPEKIREEDQHLTWPEIKRCLPVIGRSSALGAAIGILPGLGSAVACFVAYGEEKRRAKNKDEWGKGAIEGIAAPESANNAVSGPSMIPVLCLGIPGSTIAAILIGVFLIHGIQVGPTIFFESKELVFGLFAAGLLGIASYGLIGWFGSVYIGKLIARVPINIVYPTILMLTIVATYSLRSSLFDVVVMGVFGLVGYLMRKLDFSPPAFIISFVLARGAEEALSQSLLMSAGSVTIFVERPVSLLFLILGFGVLLSRVGGHFRSRRKARDQEMGDI
jgi:putative tricarboxylic transport membrane protein